MIKTWYVDGNHNLYRTIPIVSGAQIFTGTTTIGILLTVSFPGFNCTNNNSNQINKTSMCIANLILQRVP